MVRGLIRIAALASAASICAVWPLAASAQDDGTPEVERDDRELIVIGQRPDIFLGILPENELDENDIAAYGFNTIGDLVQEVSRELDPTGEGPVVLINGQLTNGIGDIADLPTEAASQIQVLPATVSARLGQSPSRRVINVVVRPDLAQITVNAEAGLATRGDRGFRLGLKPLPPGVGLRLQPFRLGGRGLGINGGAGGVGRRDLAGPCRLCRQPGRRGQREP